MFIKILLVFGIFILITSHNLTRIAFGSCNRFYESHKMDIFEKIIAQKPSHMFFLGDFVYLDGLVYPNLPSKWYPQTDQSQIHRKINNVLQSLEFKAFTQNNISVSVIWDDHDYNQNNGGESNPLKSQMLKIFRSLLNVGTIFNDSLHNLIKVDKNVQVILLDVRSYKTSQDIVNQQTWIWLQNIFKTATNDTLILLGSGIQIIYDDRILMEKWPLKSRIRLYELLDKYKTHLIVLSGDIHFGQMGQRQGLHEITSSGLSFSVADHLLMVDDIIQTFIPQTYGKHSERYAGRNFAVIDVHHFENGTIDKISNQIRDKNGEIVLQKIIQFSDTLVQIQNWQDIKTDHKYIFQKNMRQKIKQNPLRIVVYIPFMYPTVYFIFVFLELFHWKID